MSQPRYNPKTQRDDWYYRIKESFRDLTGRVRSRVMLNVGFIDEPHHLLALGTEVHAHHGRGVRGTGSADPLNFSLPYYGSYRL